MLNSRIEIAQGNTQRLRTPLRWMGATRLYRDDVRAPYVIANARPDLMVMQKASQGNYFNMPIFMVTQQAVPPKLQPLSARVQGAYAFLPQGSAARATFGNT